MTTDYVLALECWTCIAMFSALCGLASRLPSRGLLGSRRDDVWMWMWWMVGLLINLGVGWAFHTDVFMSIPVFASVAAWLIIFCSAIAHLRSVNREHDNGRTLHS